MNLRRREPLAVCAALTASLALAASGIDASPSAVYGCGSISLADIMRLRALGLPVPPPPDDRPHPLGCHAVAGAERPRKGAAPA